MMQSSGHTVDQSAVIQTRWQLGCGHLSGRTFDWGVVIWTLCRLSRGHPGTLWTNSVVIWTLGCRHLLWNWLWSVGHAEDYDRAYLGTLWTELWSSG